MKCVKTVEITFENCEGVTLPVRVLGDFYVGDIHREISRLACNAICEVDRANEVYMEIFSEANECAEKWGGLSDLPPIERLSRWMDITRIRVLYEDGTSMEVCPCYNTAYGIPATENGYQKTYLSPLGNLYIVIAKGKSIWNYFDKHSVDDVQHMKFAKEMFGVHDDPDEADV